MRIRIAAKTYELDDAIAHATLNDVKYLKKASRETDGAGITPASLQQFFLDLGKAAKEDGFDAAVWTFSDGVLEHLQAVMWLVRRKAGEDLTLEQAGDVDLSDWNFDVSTDEPVSEVEHVGPKDQAEPA